MGWLAAFVLAAMIGAAAPVWAQTLPGVPAEAPATALSAKQLEALIGTLEDPAARDAFLGRLRALAEAQRQTEPPPERGGGFLADLSESVKAASAHVVEAAAVLLDAPRLWRWLAVQLSDPDSRAQWLAGAWKLVLAILLGFLGEWIAVRLLARPRRAVEGRERDAWLVRLPFLIARTLLDVIPIAAFAAAAYGALTLVEPDDATRLVALALIYANVLARAVLAVARMVLVPQATTLRLFALADETAAYLFVWLRRITNVAVYGYFTAEALLLLGLPAAAHQFLMKLIGLVLTVMLSVFVLQNRRGVADWLRGAGGAESERRDGLQTLRDRFADIWHVLAILYLVAVYVVWAVAVPGGFEFLWRATLLSAVVLLAAALAALGVRRLIQRIFAISTDLKSRYPLLEERANRYLPVLQTVLRGAIVVFAALTILQVWGLDIYGWMAAPAGRRVISGALTIVIIVVVALVFWEIVSSAIERYLARLEAAGEAVRGARMRTLLPLARKALFVTIVVLVVLVVLSELGINIAPLLAGAGVVGLAIGFGAQTLVKDVITGLFILIEDAVAVGDVVEVAGHAGVVEGMSIRSLRLRDLSGVVHTVPFGEVATVKNMTRDFSYALMDIGVAYREDVDEVIEVIREVAEELRQDPEVGPTILEPIEVLGLDAFGDSAIVIKARIKTQPIKQWMVKRAYNRLLKRAFDARGIEIPFPHQTIYFGEDKQGNAPPVHVRMAETRAPAPPAEAMRPAAVESVDLPGEGEGE